MTCTISDVFFEDKFADELEDIKACTEKQKKIVELSKNLFKKYHNDEITYKRKPLSTKSMPMNKVRAQQVKENAVEFSQVKSGQSIRYVKFKARIWQGIRMVIGCTLLYFMAKNQIFPYLQRRYGIWKTIL